MAEEDTLNLETLLAIIILFIYTVTGPIFEKINFHYMHESGLCMIIGVLITFFSMIIGPGPDLTKTIEFNENIFFTFVLPPIIFSAGYNLRRTSFFKYFMYIISFGVVGTVMCFLVVTPLTYIMNSNNMFTLYYSPSNLHLRNYTQHMYNTTIKEKIKKEDLNYYNETFRSFNINSNNPEDNNITITPFGNLTNDNLTNGNITKNDENELPREIIIHFSLTEILLFASVISATDTIAALTFIHEDSEPKLFAILFGEGVINDAVCIVLYRILRDFTSSGEEFTTSTPFMMFSSFLSLAFFSFIIGMFVGCFCAYVLKKFKELDIKLNRMQEISVVLFFAFISYTLAEECGLSPIVSLLFSGLFMSHYAFYNLSFQAREESSVVSRMLSNIAEAFVFVYLGLTLIYHIQQSLSISFIIIELIIVVFGRIVAIFGLCYIMKVLGVKSFKMKTSQKGIMSCAGSIRGAIAFGLAISIDTPNELNKEILRSSTLILVFFTTIVFGALMPFMINIMKKLDPPEDEYSKYMIEQFPNPDKLLQCDVFNFVHPNFSQKYEGSKEKNIEILKTRLSYWLGHYWFEFDEMYIKPKLCYQWPYVHEDNLNLKKVIITAINKYEDEQKKIPHFIREEYTKNAVEKAKKEKMLLIQKEIEKEKKEKGENKKIELSNMGNSENDNNINTNNQ